MQLILINKSGWATFDIITSPPPGMGAKYCDEYVCLSLRSHNLKNARPNFTNFFPYVVDGRGSVLLGAAIRYALPVL